MQEAFFMKEPLINVDKNVSLIMVNQKQLKQTIDYSIDTILAQRKYAVVLVTLSGPGEDVLAKVKKEYLGRIVIIDAFSKNPNTYFSSIIPINSAADLTGIQIAIEKAENKVIGEKVVIIDALNVMAIYNKKEDLGKFLHILSNKTKLKENSAIIFAVGESTDEKTINQAKEFSDKSYDYSSLYISTVTLADKKEIEKQN